MCTTEVVKLFRPPQISRAIEYQQSHQSYESVFGKAGKPPDVGGDGIAGPPATTVSPQTSAASIEARRRKLMRTYKYGFLSTITSRQGDSGLAQVGPNYVPPQQPSIPDISRLQRLPGIIARGGKSALSDEELKKLFVGPGIKNLL